MNFSIKQKLIGSFLLISLFFSLAAVYSYSSAKKTETSYLYIINTVSELRIIADEIQTNTALQSGYYRGYMLYNDSIFKNRLNSANSNIENLVSEGHKLAQIDETQKRLTEIGELNKEYGQKANSIMNSAQGNKKEAINNGLQQLVPIANELTEKTTSLSSWLKKELIKPEIAKAKQEAETRMIIMITLGIATTILALLIGISQSLILTKTLNKLKNATKKVAEGNLQIEPIKIKQKDELYELNHSFNQMKNNLVDMVANISVSSNHVAASAEQLNASAEQSSKAAETITSSIQQIASRNEFTSSILVDNSQNIAFIFDNVLKIAEEAEAVSKLSQMTTEKAIEGTASVENNLKQMKFIKESVARTNTVITSLSNRSKEIEDIVTLISNIAEQTNLLALNAAIEAARAGEHGKGFSIVAEEVRKLAEQSQSSTKSIGNLIQVIQKETTESVHTLQEAIKTVENGAVLSEKSALAFSEIVKSTKKVTPKLMEVTQTISDITSRVEEVDTSAKEIVSLSKQQAISTEESAASTEEQLASMQEINASAEALAQMAEDLTYIVGKFKL
ncbi:methyl-accepting chemotaxis protein [Niallia nealsonii]|uniref:Methyl-accepting chemotaxis protein n=1 Tax=Niallia nealsonii TaxID=115979 RepID=A0A2N0YXI4_9BACI|nr:methyl-accepting chemotaxis protein [Niallia nealsonii]PKG21967.1 methyl-accepting chemotaxis protein [Niallia nealsonii]